MTRYNMSNGATTPFSDFTVQLGLTANVGLSYTVPNTNNHSYRAQFSWNEDDNVWVGYNVTATLPVLGAVSQNNGVERNPTIRFVRGGDVLNFISRANVTDIGLSLLQLPS